MDNQALRALQDRISLRDLVDRVSILGDRKEVHAQVQLFTENAVSETYSNGQVILKLKGRQEMEAAFRDFLKNTETIYHFNGQQIVDINGDNATGTSYCMATLISTKDGHKIKSTIGITYEDCFVREDGRWLIAKRVGHFDWQQNSDIQS